ncbi:MAG TPA: LacI family transcriptional regulator, partial [Caldithrix abyssi]|nr:LacI family transcriptional regulator [Caldithrix abyssi]
FNVLSMINNRVDGLIVSRSQSTTDSAHFKKALEVGIPVIFFNRICEDVKTIKVVSDDFNGAYQATQHLIERGYRRIAHFAGPSIVPACRERLAGFQKALQDAGLSCPREWILYGGMHEIDGQRSMEKLLQLKEQPEAILAVNDPVAVGAFTIIKKKGLKIPRDYALVGFSNNSVVALLEPPLTTVDEKPFVLGQKSMELLLASLKGQLELKDKEIRCQTELIIRQST